MTIQTPAGTAGPDIDLILLVEAGPARDLREHPSGRNSATPIAQAVASAGHRIVPLYTNPDRVPRNSGLSSWSPRPPAPNSATSPNGCAPCPV